MKSKLTQEQTTELKKWGYRVETLDELLEVIPKTITPRSLPRMLNITWLEEDKQ